MRDKKKAARFVGAGALAILMSTAAFAAPRGNDNRNVPTQSTVRGDQNRPNSQNPRDNSNYNVRGNGNDDARDNGSYDVRDNNVRDNRGYSVRDTRGYGSRQQYVSGVVQRFNRRSGLLTLRDENSRRTIEVATSGVRVGNFRRGDYVTVAGQWQGGNVFTAYSIR